MSIAPPPQDPDAAHWTSLGWKFAEGSANQIRQLSEALSGLRAIVDAQAEDDGLWFVAQTAPEAYLQQELRKLHAAIEAVTGAGRNTEAARAGLVPESTPLKTKTETEGGSGND